MEDRLWIPQELPPVAAKPVKEEKEARGVFILSLADDEDVSEDTDKSDVEIA